MDGWRIRYAVVSMRFTFFLLDFRHARRAHTSELSTSKSGPRMAVGPVLGVGLGLILPPMESAMLGWLLPGALLIAVSLLSPCSAQDKTKPYPPGSDITFQWNYSCPSSKGCGFICPGSGQAVHVTKLTIYLGRMHIGADQTSLALFYEFSTVEFPRGNGFVINTGLSALSCQINGMTVDYSGPPTSKSSFYRY
jgi:hypothetical protein